MEITRNASIIFIFFCFFGLQAQNTQEPEPFYHDMRGGLRNCQIRFEKEKTGRVAFLGGSITYNGGWRDSVMAYLEERFPETKFEFIAAGIPSMGTTPAAFRLERDILSKGRIDLLFEEAAVNDAGNGRTSTEQLRAMEGIVRHARVSNPAINIVMMHFVDPGKMKEYNEGRVPEVITNHTQVAIHYNIPTINLAKEVTERIENGEFTWKDDFKNLHPSPFGQGIYAKSMIHFLEAAFASSIKNDDRISLYNLPEKLMPLCYDKGYLIETSSIELTEGWSLVESWSPNDGTGVRANYVNVPMLVGEDPGGIMQMDFTGSAVGLAVAAGQDAGIIEYRIDSGNWQKLNLFTKWSKALHLPWYYTLGTGLSEGRHLLELKIIEDKDDRSSGRTCRIRYFYTNTL